MIHWVRHIAAAVCFVAVSGATAPLRAADVTLANFEDAFNLALAKAASTVSRAVIHIEKTGCKAGDKPSDATCEYRDTDIVIRVTGRAPDGPVTSVQANVPRDVNSISNSGRATRLSSLITVALMSIFSPQVSDDDRKNIIYKMLQDSAVNPESFNLMHEVDGVSHYLSARDDGIFVWMNSPVAD